jgi:hypothetical protein
VAVEVALSPFVIAPLRTAPLRVLSVIDVTSFVSTALNPRPSFFTICLSIASLGQGFPEHGIQLHAVLREGGRAKRQVKHQAKHQAKQKGGSRGSKRQP